MAKPKMAAATSVQLGIEKGLRIAVFILAAMHTLLSLFRYAVDISAFQSVERWFALVLLTASVTYLFVTKIRYPNTFYRIRSFFSAMKSYEQLFLIAMFLWLVLVCWIWQLTSNYSFLKAFDWYLLDTGISVLVLFPLALFAGEKKAKLCVEGLFHIAAISYTVFTGWCLWHVFHLNILTLPSGSQVGLTSRFQLMIGCHYNITGAISFTILAIACYMILSKGIILKVIYGISAVLHLCVCMLSNSRTVFICVLFLGAVVVFSLLWNSLRVKKAGIRLLLSVSAACTAALILWWLRDASFVWFDQITGFKSHVSIKTEEDIRELTDLSGRPEVWLGALKIIVHDPKTFFLGVTPLGITPALKTYGGLSGDFAHAHNIVLQVGASMGVPAMIAFTVFIVRITIQCVRAYIESKGLKIKKTFMIPAIIASLLIMNLAEAYLVAYFSVMSCVFYLACGILVYRLKS